MNRRSEAKHYGNAAAFLRVAADADFPVRPLRDGAPATRRAFCGTCKLSWDDAILTGWTPAPAARCPFEYFHSP